MAIKVVHQLNTAFIKSYQITKKNNKLPSYDITKIYFSCNTKDRTPTLNKAFVIYESMYLKCSANNAGKTEKTLFERNVGHVWKNKYSVVNIHLNQCNGVLHMFDLTYLTPSLFSNSIFLMA